MTSDNLSEMLRPDHLSQRGYCVQIGLNAAIDTTWAYAQVVSYYIVPGDKLLQGADHEAGTKPFRFVLVITVSSGASVASHSPVMATTEPVSYTYEL